MNNLMELLNALAFMLQNQYQLDVITLNTIINGFYKMGRIEEALKVLNDMILGKVCAPDAVNFTSIICGLLNIGRAQEVFNFLHHIMPERVARSGVMTYNAILYSLFKLQQANEAIGTFNRMASEGILVDNITYRAYVHLVQITSKCDP